MTVLMAGALAPADASVLRRPAEPSVLCIEDLRTVRGSPARSVAVPTKIAWRYRWKLVPVWIGLGLLGGSMVAHAYAPGAWLIAVPLGAAGTAGWWLRADAGLERRLAVVLGSATTLWVTAGWWASPLHQSLMVSLVLGVLATAIPWWRRESRRDRTALAMGRRIGRRAMRRELRRLTREWPVRSSAADLLGSHIHRVDDDEHGYALMLTLRPGQTVTDVVANMARLESILETRPGGIHIAADESRADRCRVRVLHRDPLAVARPWTGPSGESIADPVQLGMFSGGGRVDISLLGEHMLIAGAPRRGTSGLANVIIAELAARCDVVLWGIDCTGGLELAPWRRVLDRLAASPGEAFEALEAACRVLDVRARLMGARGQRRWRPTPTEPALVLLVDEVAELAGDSMALFQRLARLGRAPGIGLVAITRHPSTALGSLDGHNQLTTRVCLGVVEARDVDAILGPGRLGTGWRAERLELPGSFLILAPGQHETPRPARAFWLSEEAAADAAVRFGRHRTALDADSAAAAGAPGQNHEGDGTRRVG